MKSSTLARFQFLGHASLFGLCLATAACSASTDDPRGPAPSVYEFESRFEPGESSVAYSGQTMRLVLIESLVAEIERIDAEIREQGTVFSEGEVAARLDFYYSFDSETGGTLEHAVATDPAPLQVTFDDISTDKDLQGKIAGNDPVGQHADWSTELVGWDGSSPDAMVRAWFAELDALAVAHSTGAIPTDPSGSQIGTFYVSADGLDYKQLIEKFLLGAIAFSQGADDYLDDDTEGKGLLSDHSGPDGDKPYTSLEHQWDEGFGYWGAARDYLAMSDDQIADSGYVDVDGDGKIDLGSEICFGASTNAAKRDRGSAPSASTDYTRDTMEAFLAGRHLLATTEGPLSDAELAELQGYRDAALDGWERAIAASAIHYFNETIAMTATADFDFVTAAKKWSELKGFLLSLQFNPRSPVTDADFAAIHEQVGTAPTFDAAGVEAYRASLTAARDRLAAAYDFDAANVGDANGENGW